MFAKIVLQVIEIFKVPSFMYMKFLGLDKLRASETREPFQLT